MERDWLASRLAEGRSIESIARECGRHPSTVAYWVSKHGLVSQHAERHAPRGALDGSRLESLVEQGLSIRQIAAEVDRSPASVRHWLRRFGLKTRPARYWRRDDARPDRIMRCCPRHDWTVFRSAGGTQYRCVLCSREGVAERRRRIKQILVAEAGGRCSLCGYDRCAAALHFHHIEPAAKAFTINGQGTTRALNSLRTEARKCTLLCANCHAEVEAGVTALPYHVRQPSGGTSGPG